MKILLNVLLLVVGFVALIKGADWFVDGSAGLAKNFRVPGLIIGLTIVALGTSAPELAVSTSAALAGSNEIALSNVVGSNIFNLLVVLGSCAVIRGVPVEETAIVKRDFPISIIGTLFVLFACCGSVIFSGQMFKMSMADQAGTVYRWVGITLLIVFIGYILYLIHDARKNPTEEDEIEKKPVGMCFVLILIGIGLIVAGGELVVDNAKEIARALGMTETLIGLTVVALGTSLPELATSIVAARKGEVGLAVGNAIGSNIFNLMLILGVSSSIHPVAVNIASVYDMFVLIAISIMTMVFAMSGKKIKRWEGAVMLLAYIAETVFAIMRG